MYPVLNQLSSSFTHMLWHSGAMFDRKIHSNHVRIWNFEITSAGDVTPGISMSNLLADLEYGDALNVIIASMSYTMRVPLLVSRYMQVLSGYEFSNFQDPSSKVRHMLDHARSRCVYILPWGHAVYRSSNRFGEIRAFSVTCWSRYKVLVQL